LPHLLIDSLNVAAVELCRLWAYFSRQDSYAQLEVCIYSNYCWEYVAQRKD